MEENTVESTKVESQEVDNSVETPNIVVAEDEMDNAIEQLEGDMPESYDDKEVDINLDDMSEEDLDNLLNELEEDSESEFKLPEKFNSVEDLLKSYQMLEGKMGSFKGAPDVYEIEGVDMDTPIMQELAETAKELNMSNEAFGKLINKYETSRDHLNQLAMQEEVAKLGKNYETRINNLNAKIDANLSEHQAQTLKQMATTADGIAVIETLLQRIGGSTPTTMQASSAMPSEAEVQQMMYAKDQYGNLKIETDSAYAAKVNKLMQNMWG